jgi:hypothetical protein
VTAAIADDVLAGLGLPTNASRSEKTGAKGR